MYYGDEKRLQMARSLLPSKQGSKAKKDQQRIKRRARRKLRQELAEVVASDGLVPDELDLQRWPSIEIGYHVRYRRGADKLGPFHRWTQAITADVPRADRLSTVRRMVPEGLIGDHAISHARWWEHIESEADRADRLRWRARWQRRRQQSAMSRAERYRLLRAVLEDGRALGMLNSALRDRHAPCRWARERWVITRWVERHGQTVRQQEVREHADTVGPAEARRLLGPGDLSAFLDDLEAAAATPKWLHLGDQATNVRVERVEIRGDETRRVSRNERTSSRQNPAHHPEWTRALDAFLTVWRDADGDLAKTRRALGRALDG